MLEKTVFTNKTIISAVKKKYNIDIYKIEKLNRGTANIYSLNDNKYIFKEFQSRFNKKDIIKEIKIINQALQNNCSDWISKTNEKGGVSQWYLMIAVYYWWAWCYF